MRANNQRPYTPREGAMISDINRAWERLEKAEHERELALREELIRQEKLEQLAARYILITYFCNNKSNLHITSHPDSFCTDLTMNI